MSSLLRGLMAVGTLAVIGVLALGARGQVPAGTSVSCVESGPELVAEWSYLPGEANYDDQHPIATPRAAAFGHDGRAFILDTRADAVAILDSNGQFVRSVGGSGDGDGEFVIADAISPTSAGGFAVLDSELDRVQSFSPHGELEEVIWLRPRLAHATHFIVLPDRRLAVSGVLSGSDNVVHVFRSDGSYETGYGRIRAELEDIELIRRYSGGIFALVDKQDLLHAQRTPFRLLRLSHAQTATFGPTYDRLHVDVVHDYALEMSERQPGGTWKWKWRHPSLVGLVPVDGCVVASVLVPGASEVQTLADFNTALWFLDQRTGHVLREEEVSGVFAPVAMRHDDGGLYRFLAIRLDPTTGGLYPAQYVSKVR